MNHTVPVAKPAMSHQEEAMIDSVTLMRLIEEVRNERDDVSIARSYDRTHNRHNR